MHRTTHWNRKKAGIHLALLAALSLAGWFVTASSSAANFVGAQEAEDGLSGSTVASVDDAAASGVRYVRFGVVTGDHEDDAMPVGDQPGWRQILAEDFNTDSSPANFDAAYARSW